MSDSTTIKVSTATRDRIRSFGGDTHEATITAALDALDREQFWHQAEAAAAARQRLSPAASARRSQAEADLDAALDGVE